MFYLVPNSKYCKTDSNGSHSEQQNGIKQSEYELGKKANKASFEIHSSSIISNSQYLIKADDTTIFV